MEIIKIRKMGKTNISRTQLSKKDNSKIQNTYRKKKSIRHKRRKLPISKNHNVEVDQPQDLHRNNCNSTSSISFEQTSSPRNQQVKENKFELNYEKSLARTSEELKTNVKSLLPIKTKNGIVRKQLIEKLNADANLTKDKEHISSNETNLLNKNEDSENEIPVSIPKPITTVELLGRREEIIKLYKYRIGILSSEILEDPAEKATNFLILLRLMEERNPEICVTIKKLVFASLLEIFKDILPSYNILLFHNDQVKLKKETLQLQKQEALILKYYKQYLIRLEKIANALKKKQHSTNLKEEEINLGMFAINCMCDLIITRPYFNFSTNIAYFLVPFLDSKYPNIRQFVANCFERVFEEDKRGELSLIIVRHLNQYIKVHKNLVHTEIITILRSLKIEDMDFNTEKHNEKKYKKLVLHKKRILALSKKERKRKNKLEQIEKEMLETKAEENKSNKHKAFTEIINIVFTIYFRILKETSNSQILSSCLEGLSKFSHCINIDFYNDLLNVLDKLLGGGHLNLKDQLYCIHTVLLILSGDTATLNIDPSRFYTHLYQNLFDVHIQNNSETDILMKILFHGLIHRSKNLTQNRLLAFVKRISTMALYLQHNSVLGIIYILKLVLQNCKATDILLDTDTSVGDGLYTPELNDPEYCNAFNSTLWETVALQRYYHPVVKVVAENIVYKIPYKQNTYLPIEILKLSPDEVYKQYNPSDGQFKPTAVIPKTLKLKNIYQTSFTDSFNKFVTTIETKKLFESGYFDIFKEIKKIK